MSERSSRPQREPLGRPPRMVVLPLVLVIVIAVGWSVAWYVGTRRADERLAAWLAEEAAHGRTYDCAERSIGGYPFRVELTCTKPSADIADAEPRLVARAEELRAVAMVWRLDHVIVEIDGPLRVETPDGAGESDVAMTAEWSLWQASLRAPGGRIEQVDVAARDLRLAPDAGSVGDGVLVSADRFQIHERHNGETTDAEVAISADGLVVALDGMSSPDAVDLALIGRLIALPSPAPRQPADFVAAWRDNRGSVVIKDMRATQGETVLHATGRLAPDAAGRPEGTVTVSLAGPDVTTPGVAGAFGGVAPVLATALRLAGRPSELDGRSAVSGDIDLRDGAIYFGPLPLGEIPALF